MKTNLLFASVVRSRVRRNDNLEGEPAFVMNEHCRGRKFMAPTRGRLPVGLAGRRYSSLFD